MATHMGEYPTKDDIKSLRNDINLAKRRIVLVLGGQIIDAIGIVALLAKML